MRLGHGDIELAGLCKSFDGVTQVVDGINLKISDGAYCCFLGPSGCGKTTILRMIAGHEDPTHGEILIGGEQVVGLAPVERRTAMMFQSYALFPHLNVRDNIAFADMVVVMEKGRIKQAGPARDVYDQPRDRYVAEFLGGQNVLSGRIERIEGDSAVISAQEMRDVVVPLGARRTVSAGDRVDFAVRRDDVGLMRPESVGTSGRARVPSRVR